MLLFTLAWDFSCWCKCIYRLSNCIFHRRVQFSALSLFYTTPTIVCVFFFPISNLLIHADFSLSVPLDSPPWAAFFSTTSASNPRPPPALSFSFLPTSQAGSDCQPTSEPSGGSAGIKDGMMRPIFSMPQCSEDVVRPRQNQSYVCLSFDMSGRAVADVLSFQGFLASVL